MPTLTTLVPRSVKYSALDMKPLAGVVFTQWRVESLGDDKYRLSANGDVTGVNNHIVVAFLLEQQKQENAENWFSIARSNTGENKYTRVLSRHISSFMDNNLAISSIEIESRTEGWVVTEEEKAAVRHLRTTDREFLLITWVAEQIVIRPLIIRPSFPPYFPPIEFFEFVRIDREE